MRLGSGSTDRELEVLRLVAAGRNNRDIAAELFISGLDLSGLGDQSLPRVGENGHTWHEGSAYTAQNATTSAPTGRWS